MLARIARLDIALRDKLPGVLKERLRDLRLLRRLVGIIVLLVIEVYLSRTRTHTAPINYTTKTTLDGTTIGEVKPALYGDSAGLEKWVATNYL